VLKLSHFMLFTLARDATLLMIGASAYLVMIYFGIGYQAGALSSQLSRCYACCRHSPLTHPSSIRWCADADHMFRALLQWLLFLTSQMCVPPFC
jgi:hypothetical protein